MKKSQLHCGACMENFNVGIEGLENGKREIEDAIDALSEHI